MAAAPTIVALMPAIRTDRTDTLRERLIGKLLYRMLTVD
jgi:hypothetical protein